MEESQDRDRKAKADREKFESITKIETSPIILRGSRGTRPLNPGALKSPDELNPKWVVDPQEAIEARKAAKKAKRSSKTQDPEQPDGK
jgi:hypothetical protein